MSRPTSPKCGSGMVLRLCTVDIHCHLFYPNSWQLGRTNLSRDKCPAPIPQVASAIFHSEKEMLLILCPNLEVDSQISVDQPINQSTNVRISLGSISWVFRALGECQHKIGTQRFGNPNLGCNPTILSQTGWPTWNHLST